MKRNDNIKTHLTRYEYFFLFKIHYLKNSLLKNTPFKNIARGTTDPGYKVYNLSYLFNFYHEVVQLTLIPNLATNWRHLHWFVISKSHGDLKTSSGHCMLKDRGPSMGFTSFSLSNCFRIKASSSSPWSKPALKPCNMKLTWQSYNTARLRCSWCCPPPLLLNESIP